MVANGSTWCSATNCGNNRKNQGGLSFFRFPRDPKRSVKWVQFTGRTDLCGRSSIYLQANCKLCSLHFEESQFMNDKRNSLVWDAVPTIFDFPYSQKCGTSGESVWSVSASGQSSSTAGDKCKSQKILETPASILTINEPIKAQGLKQVCRLRKIAARKKKLEQYLSQNTTKQEKAAELRNLNLSEDTLKCVICNESTAPLITLRKGGCAMINQASEVLNDDLHALPKQCVHVLCRIRYVNSAMKHCKPCEAVPAPENASNDVFQSSEREFHINAPCLFCGKKPRYFSRRQTYEFMEIVKTKEFKDNLLLSCEKRGDALAATLKARVLEVPDLCAAGVQYHPLCSVRFRTENPVPVLQTSKVKTSLQKDGCPMDGAINGKNSLVSRMEESLQDSESQAYGNDEQQVNQRTNDNTNNKDHLLLATQEVKDPHRLECVICKESTGSLTAMDEQGCAKINNASEVLKDNVHVLPLHLIHESCHYRYISTAYKQVEAEERSLGGSTIVDFRSECFFCSSKRKYISGMNYTQAKYLVKSKTFTDRLLAFCDERGDAWAATVKARVLQVPDLLDAGAKYHPVCRDHFFNKECTANNHMEAKKRIFGKSMKVMFNFRSECFFCCSKRKYFSEKSYTQVKYLVKSKIFTDKLLAYCDERGDTWAVTVKDRVLQVPNLLDAGAKYHPVCRDNFFNEKCLPPLRTRKPQTVWQNGSHPLDGAKNNAFTKFGEPIDEHIIPIDKLVSRMDENQQDLEKEAHGNSVGKQSTKEKTVDEDFTMDENGTRDRNCLICKTKLFKRGGFAINDASEVCSLNVHAYCHGQYIANSLKECCQAEEETTDSTEIDNHRMPHSTKGTDNMECLICKSSTKPLDTLTEIDCARINHASKICSDEIHAFPDQHIHAYCLKVYIDLANKQLKTEEEISSAKAANNRMPHSAKGCNDLHDCLGEGHEIKRESEDSVVVKVEVMEEDVMCEIRAKEELEDIGETTEVNEGVSLVEVIDVKEEPLEFPWEAAEVAEEDPLMVKEPESDFPIPNSAHIAAPETGFPILTSPPTISLGTGFPIQTSSPLLVLLSPVVHVNPVMSQWTQADSASLSTHQSSI